MKRKYFIVSEGETDFEVLRAIIEEHARPLGRKVKVDPLFPGTGRGKSNGGWSNLKSWCNAQSNDLAGTKNLAAAAAALGANVAVNAPTTRRKDKITAALMLQPPFESITFIFQLDTDVAEHYMSDTKYAHLPIPLSTQQRREVGEAALDVWLGEHSAKKGSSFIYCVSTQAIETILLANHTPAEIAPIFAPNIAPQDYDDINNPDQVLVALGYTQENQNGMVKIKKTQAKYKAYSTKFFNNLAAARQRSLSLETFLHALG